MNISIEELRQLNPQYRRDIVPARPDKPYILKLPSDAISAFIDNESQIFAYNRDKYFPNNMLVPLKGPYRATKGTSAEGMREITHVVKSGDKLGTLASKYRVSINDLKEWNDLRKSTLRIGQRITLYVPGKSLKSKEAVIEKPKSGSQTLASQSTELKSPKTAISKAEAGGDTTQAGEYIIYTVQSGDSLFTIAKKFPGISDADLRAFNNIRNVRGLYPGQQLKIPKRA